MVGKYTIKCWKVDDKVVKYRFPIFYYGSTSKRAKCIQKNLKGTLVQSLVLTLDLIGAMI